MVLGARCERAPACGVRQPSAAFGRGAIPSTNAKNPKV
jgi:hypothetical protein